MRLTACSPSTAAHLRFNSVTTTEHSTAFPCCCSCTAVNMPDCVMRNERAAATAAAAGATYNGNGSLKQGQSQQGLRPSDESHAVQSVDSVAGGAVHQASRARFMPALWIYRSHPSLSDETGHAPCRLLVA